jgi:hypothetical protein
MFEDMMKTMMIMIKENMMMLAVSKQQEAILAVFH